ncbi:SDR family oxidoreductase [Kribbella antibiotica]|uniref:SDR family oxidoreductase n=1 Tax=Kribbella antibiotica TaxID=190195 RepID=A0A4R4ZWG1_9ACTN|nr:SDR family oxidoreductase [Kribbella antibiotica]TDD62696.1 SDR family oxidoreductase [Kribbella antibiotica]
MARILDGRVAVITGGTAGIGLATAERFVAEGASVVIVGRRQEELDKAVAQLGIDTLGVAADVARPEDLDRLYAEVAERYGRIDVLFANASIAEGGAMGSLTDSHVDRHIDINLKGLIYTVEKALPLLSDGASVIVTASVDEVKGGPGRSVYAATKAAGRNLVRSWMQELAPRKIRVNAVSPGITETPGLAKLGGGGDTAEFFAQLAATMPDGRNVTPEEVAAAVTFLASPDAAGINGINLPVDHGQGQG